MEYVWSETALPTRAYSKRLSPCTLHMMLVTRLMRLPVPRGWIPPVPEPCGLHSDEDTQAQGPHSVRPIATACTTPRGLFSLLRNAISNPQSWKLYLSWICSTYQGHGAWSVSFCTQGINRQRPCTVLLAHLKEQVEVEG